MWSKEWLQGSLRFDCSAEERGIFADLLALANESRNRGIIQANETTPYPHLWIASTLNIPYENFEKALQKLIVQERIEETIFGLKIVNFNWYQREFTKRGRPSKQPPQTIKTNDPDKYIHGKYGHMVQR